MSNNTKGAIFALASYGLYACHDALIKFLGGVYSPLQVVFFSALLGLPLVTAMLVGDKSRRSLRPKSWGPVMARTGFMVVGIVCGFTAFSKIPMAQAYAVYFTAPMLTTVLAVIFLKERIGWHRGLAIAAGLVGVIISLNPGATTISSGHLYALIGASCVSCTVILTRSLSARENPIVLLALPMIAIVALIGLAMPFVYRPMEAGHFGMMALIAIVAWAAARCMILALSYGEASSVAPMHYSQILWAVFFGSVVFGERLSLNNVIGIAIIIASGLYILLRESRVKIQQVDPASAGGGQ